LLFAHEPIEQVLLRSAAFLELAARFREAVLSFRDAAFCFRKAALRRRELCGAFLGCAAAFGYLALQRGDPLRVPVQLGAQGGFGSIAPHDGLSRRSEPFLERRDGRVFVRDERSAPGVAAPGHAFGVMAPRQTLAVAAEESVFAVAPRNWAFAMPVRGRRRAVSLGFSRIRPRIVEGAAGTHLRMPSRILEAASDVPLRLRPHMPRSVFDASADARLRMVRRIVEERADLDRPGRVVDDIELGQDRQLVGRAIVRERFISGFIRCFSQMSRVL
jgi:hypothetical protein